MILFIICFQANAQSNSYIRQYMKLIHCNTKFIDTSFKSINPNNSILFYAFNSKNIINEDPVYNIQLNLEQKFKGNWKDGVTNVFQFKFIHKNVDNNYHKNAIVEEWIFSDTIKARIYLESFKVSSTSEYNTHLKEFQNIWQFKNRVFVLKIGNANYMIDMVIITNQIKAIEKSLKNFIKSADKSIKY